MPLRRGGAAGIARSGCREQGCFRKLAIFAGRLRTAGRGGPMSASMEYYLSARISANNPSRPRPIRQIIADPVERCHPRPRRTGRSRMKSAVFSAWLAGLSQLTPKQRQKVLRQLLPAEAVDRPQTPPPGNQAAETSESLLSQLERTRARLGCPHCGSADIRPWGTVSGRPRFRCADCRKTFNAVTGTPLAHAARRSAVWGCGQACGGGAPRYRPAPARPQPHPAPLLLTELGRSESQG